MDSGSADVDYEALDRLLGALAQSVANRVEPAGARMAAHSSIPRAALAAWREPAAPVLVDALPRGVPLEVVLRGALKHFLPGAAALLVPLYALLVLLNPLDHATNLRALAFMFLSTAGFALGLGAMSRWLYPHSNPDGQRSDVAGLASPVVALLAVSGSYWLLPALGAMTDWVAPLLSGLAVAVLAFAPWLRRTSRIAPASPRGRWAKLRAAASTGVLGAAVFGSLPAVRLLVLPPPSGRLDSWPTFFFFNVVSSASYGFVIGAAFALALGVVYRRHAVEELTAWKVGLWGAAAASLPPLTLSILGGTVPPLSELLPIVFMNELLPGFLMAYAMVRLAQWSGPKTRTLIATAASKCGPSG